MVGGLFLSLFPVVFSKTTWPILLFTSSYYLTAWFLHGRLMRLVEPTPNVKREWVTIVAVGVASCLSAIIYGVDQWLTPADPRQFFGTVPSLLAFGVVVFLHIALPLVAFVVCSKEEV